MYTLMDNVFVVSGIISFVFLIIKFIEMRFLDKENKPVKLLIRDTLVVYFSVIVGYFILEQLNTVIVSGVASTQPTVFTDNPTF